jgi:signal transduction histidine kinase
MGDVSWGQTQWLLWRGRVLPWLARPQAGSFVLLAGVVGLTLLVALVDRLVVPLPDPGLIYLPLIGMLAYHWGWRYAAIATVLELVCVYLFLIDPYDRLKSLTIGSAAQLMTIAAATGFTLSIVQLARVRRAIGEREAQQRLVEHHAREEAESQLHLLQTVIDELPSAVYLVRGREARLLLANRATRDTWGAEWRRGVAMREFLRTNQIRIFAPDGRLLPEDELATLRTLRTDVAVRQHQVVIRRPDDTTLPVLCNAVALPAGTLAAATGPGGLEEAAEPAALAVLQDVTALKEAERLKDEFIGIAAHELKNPMAVIKGYADMLIRQTARGKGPALAGWQTEAIGAIDEATTRLVELTSDLLDVTRLQAGRLEIHVEPADLAALARRVAHRLQITSEGHALQVTAESEHVVACMDTSRVEQVLGNLINNAIKYSPRGGDVLIAVCEQPAQGMAEVSVRDSGIGIPAEQQARIFSRFARATNARAAGIGGTGLGLYLCRELVERQGGRIWFESAEGQGSTFHVMLPLATGERPTDETGALLGVAL